MSTATFRGTVRDAVQQAFSNGRHETSDPKFTTELVTPAKAEKWLERNVINRPVRRSLVAQYAADMRNGRWELNAEAIKFDTDGNMIDGQHRLHAVIASGSAVRMSVARGLAASTFATLDRGAKRTGADYLHLLGEVDCNNLAAALGHLRRYGRGDLWESGAERYHVSTPELDETLEAHPGIRDSVRFTCRVRHLGSGGLFAFLHYVFAKKDAVLADWFMESLATGEGLTAGDAVYRLREILLRNRVSKARLRRTEIMRLTITAWNKHRAGGTCRQLRATSETPDIE